MSSFELFKHIKTTVGTSKRINRWQDQKSDCDRGYKIKGGIPSIDIVMPKVLKRESYYLKRKGKSDVEGRGAYITSET